MKKLLLALLFSLILVLAACGGDDAESKDSDTSSDTEQSADSSTPDPNNEVNIVASNFQFDKDVYTVKSGEEVKVSLKNDEGMHGITIEGLDVNIDGEGEATFTPTEPGEYKIICSIMCGEGHGDMVSTLVVQ
ncbi:cupredoxin domain-containing protein [Paucisalibacillus globulus]|uniref:cupredoxin domain-containing protein n=1 Tax=Paucisalibacillus globulus TaxID=351095 RepID=UPI000404285B|nr:cupredoxin domain-containing protein [Paucisalibacillus globulus]